MIGPYFFDIGTHLSSLSCYSTHTASYLWLKGSSQLTGMRYGVWLSWFSNDDDDVSSTIFRRSCWWMTWPLDVINRTSTSCHRSVVHNLIPYFCIWHPIVRPVYFTQNSSALIRSLHSDGLPDMHMLHVKHVFTIVYIKALICIVTRLHVLLIATSRPSLFRDGGLSDSTSLLVRLN